jgi:primosomal protein N' (replication factor Y)
MYFYRIYCRGVNDIFTWGSARGLSLGCRVWVPFRNQRKIGIIIEEVEKPTDFKIRNVLSVLDENFINEKYVNLARKIANDNFSSEISVLNLMLPEKFLVEEAPVKMEISYKLVQPEQDDKADFEQKINKLRGIRQQKTIEILRENEQVDGGFLESKIPKLTLENLIKQGLIIREIGGIKKIKLVEKLVRENDFELTKLQQEVFEKIIKSKLPVLLFGVTGSGKTEIYKKLAKFYTDEKTDAQVLFLLPEIALTTQLIAEFRNVFGEKIALWHSNLSNGEKIQEWARMQSGEAKILIGARSAIFVPMKNPQLIILDEEHEWTYKNEFAPRFWTHDVAEEISRVFGAKLLFGSATPRIESLYNCEQGKWLKTELLQRVFETKLPKVLLVDLANETKKGNYHPISGKLKEEISRVLKAKKQIVIFLNKRGYAGSTMCKACGKTIDCKACERPMKAHRGENGEVLVCHVCGYFEQMSLQCPSCGMKNFEFRGWGTQQVEEELKLMFPEARIVRADADSITKKHDFENLMTEFSKHKADILLGTQMIAKGLDFENVELVGVILADVGLNLPDFRAEERVFQLLTQVSGRAGRRKIQGKIIIQTFNKEEQIFKFVKKHNITGFLQWQQEIRQKLKMPPFANIIKITFSNEDKSMAFVAAKSFFLKTKKAGFEVHFMPAFFPKMHNKYFFHCLFKTNDLLKFREFLNGIEIPEGARIDINPASVL